MGKFKSIKEAFVELINERNEHNEQPYKKIRNFYYKDFLSFFPPAHQKLIAKIYLKNQILHIIVRHQVAYQELKHDNTKFYIKKLIKDYVKFKPNELFSQAVLEGGGVKEVKVFFKILEQNQNKTEEKVQEDGFIELSLGEFKNLIKDEKLHLKFEKIREIIKKNLANSKLTSSQKDKKSDEKS